MANVGPSNKTPPPEVNKAAGFATPGYEKQRAVVYDLISAGEIQGLVGGLSGVYLNDTSIIDSTSMIDVQSKLGTATVSGTAVTSATNTAGIGLFTGITTADLTNNPRYLQIKGAGKSSTLSAAAKENANSIVVTADNTFNDGMVNPIGKGTTSSSYDPVVAMIRIAGGAADGGEYRGIITGIASSSGTNNKAYITPRLGKDVPSGAAVAVDAVRAISAIGSNTACTLVSAVDTNPSGSTQTKLSSAVRAAGEIISGQTIANYENTEATVYPGTRTQHAHDKPGQRPNASYVVSPSHQMQWHTSNYSGSSSGQATYFINGDTFSFTQHSKQEVDRVKITVEFPGGMYYDSSGGRDLQTYAEFQIVVEHKSSASDPYTRTLVVGKNYGGANFDSSIPAWNKDYDTQVNFYKSGGSRHSNDGVVSRKSKRVKFLVEYNIDLTPFQPLEDWRIGIKRLSPQNTTDFADEKHSYVGLATIKTAEAIIEERFSYPLSAYGVVEFSAEDFTTPPKRAYHIRGKKVKVPSNYITREELGTNQAKYTRHKTNGNDTGSYVTWDGSFRGNVGAAQDVNKHKVYTNNPAWIFYDILTDKDIGLGHFIEESDVDIYALYQIARYCDELVSDGKGGQEPRFSCNVYFAAQEEAYKVLKDLASAFRGMMFWIDGQITPIQDKFQEPVYTFTNGNVEEGQFNYTFTGERARPNQINVTWNNPAELFKQTVLTIEDTENILSTGKIISKDVVAFGVTSEAQAQRLGKWHFLTDTQETELVNFTTGINASFLRPGDYINVQDHTADSIIASGRVSSGTTSNVTLDRQVALTGYHSGSNLQSPPTFVRANASHILYLIYPNSGTYLDQASATINNVAYERGSLIIGDASGNPITSLSQASNLVDDSGNTVVAQFSKNTRIEKVEIGEASVGHGSVTLPLIVSVYSGLTSAPNSEVIWAIGPRREYATAEIKQFRILSLSEEEDNHTYQISGALVSVDKYDNIEKDTPVYVPDYSQFSGAALNVPPPTNLTIELVAAASSSIDGAEHSLEGIISWTPPEESFVDSGGSTSDIPYRFANQFEVVHNLEEGPLKEGFTAVTVGGNKTSLRIPNASAGEYEVRVRTISDSGARSVYAVARRIVTAPVPNLNRIVRIARGGVLTTSLDFDYSNGKVLFEESAYTYVPPSAEALQISNATTAQKEVSFAPMANTTTGYLYYDRSAAPSNPWKAVVVYTDTVAQNSTGGVVNQTYFREISSANNGLTATSGTVSSVGVGTTVLIGTGTAFTTDFAPGDLIKITAATSAGTQQSDAEYAEVSEVETNTRLNLSRSLTKSHTNVRVYKQTLKPDFGEDAILAQVQKGNTGLYAFEAFVNARGRRGAGRWQIPVNSIPTTTAQAQAAWDSSWADRPGSPVVGDQANFFEGTLSNFTATAAWSYDGAIWINQAEIIDGDLIVTGTVTTDKIFANAITADKIAANSINANKIAANSIAAEQIAANSVTANKISANSITTEQIAANAVTANAITGNSVVATLIAASAVTASDISASNLSAINANLGNITAGTLKNSGSNAIPDANTAPSGSEVGGFIDLNQGKFVFGSASKHILWNGTDLTLSGVTIDANSTLPSTGISTIKEDGTTEGTDITSINITTGLDLSVSSNEATISVNQPYLRASVSATDAGGLGSFTYNNSSGVFTYTGPSNADIRGLLSVATTTNLGSSLTYDNTLGQYSYTAPTTSAVRGLFSGSSGISYNSSTGNISVSSITFGMLAGAAVQISGEAFSDSDTILMTSAAIQDKIQSFNYSTTTGTVTSVATGNGLTGGTITGSGTLAVGQGSGISVSSNAVAVDGTVVRTTGTQTIGGNKTFSNNIVVSGNLTVSGTSTTINTETVNIADNKILLNSNYTGGSPTEDAGIEVERGTQGNVNFIWKESNVGESGNLAAGWTFGGERVQAGTFFGTFVGDVTGTPSSLAGLTTDNLTEGANNLYFTNARARGSLSGGQGITYNSSTGGISVDVNGGLALSNSGVAVSGVTTSMIAAGSILIGGEAFVDNDTQLMTAAAVNDRITSFNYSTTTGTVTSVAVTTGTGLDGAGTITSSGTIALSLDLSELTDMTAAVTGSVDELILLDNGAERRKRFAEIGLSAFSNDLNFTSNTGDITGVTATAGNGLTGTSTTSSGNASFTFNVGAGSGISVAADAVAVDSTVIRTTGGQTISGELNVTRNSGVTGSSAPTYTQANIELQTASNHVPAISFHRGGYSATTLYEYNGELYANAWTTRSQTGLLLSSGNIGSYALTSSSTIDADTLNGASENVSASNSTIVKRHSSGYIFSNYINTTDNSVTSNVTGIIVKQSSNDYHRTATAAAVRTFLNVADGANAYSLPTASASTKGGITTNYTTSGRNYKVQMSGTNAYVNVPWTDTVTTDTNTVTSIRQNNTGTYRTGNINLVSGTNITVSESSAGTFSFATSANVAAGSGNVVFDIISADEIRANHIVAGAISARELAISNSASGSAGIYFSTTAMEIHDGTRIRVKIGSL